MLAANLNIAFWVAGMLCELRWRVFIDDFSAQAAWKANSLALDVTTGLFEDLQRFWVAPKLNAYLFQYQVGIVLDQAQALFI